MKTIQERKKEILELMTPEQIEEYLETYISDNTVYAEYSKEAQKEIKNYAFSLIRLMRPSKPKDKKRKDKGQQSAIE